MAFDYCFRHSNKSMSNAGGNLSVVCYKLQWPMYAGHLIYSKNRG